MTLEELAVFKTLLYVVFVMVLLLAGYLLGKV